MPNAKYGWKPKRAFHPMLHLGDYVVSSEGELPLHAALSPVDFRGLVPSSDLNILGNDDAGNCVEAGTYHAFQTLTQDGFIPLTSQAIGWYSTLTGYVPGDPSTDQGTDIPTALDWWMSNELPGTTSQLGAYFSVDVNDPGQQALALQLGGVLLVGGNIPQSAETQFDQGQPWTPVRHSPIAGGHCWTVEAINSAYGAGVTWGKYQQWSWSFWQQYVQECYVLFNEVWVQPSGTAPNGILWSAMNSDIQTAFGKPGPFTDPGGNTPPVTPPPTAYTPETALVAIQQVLNGVTAD